MTAKEILVRLQAIGNENTRRIFSNHGAPTNQFGVKIEDLKKLQKKIKKDYKLSLELYDSGISDAQYLAGLIADETKITKEDLQHWADAASWYMISEYTVPWITAESAYGWEMGIKWINSNQENLQSSGWSTLASVVTIKPDDELDKSSLKHLLARVDKEIHAASNRVRYAMNVFVIAVGGYVPELSACAIKTGVNIGKVTVNMGGTACKVPFSPDYIKKMVDRGVRKKKMARCL